MAEGNGIDLGSIFGLLPQLQEQMKVLHGELKTGLADGRAETAEHRAEMHAQRAEIRAEMRAQGAEFRQMVGRVEEHLALPPIAHP